MNQPRESHISEIKKTLSHTIRMACLAVLMNSTARAETNIGDISQIFETAPARVSVIINGEITGPEISKKFE